MYFYLIIVVSIVIDLATKIAIRMHLGLGERTEILGGFIRLTHYQNTGTSGNLFHGQGRLLAVIVLILVAAAFYLRSKGKFTTPLMQVGLALFIGGATGNAIDRIVYNHVTDFLHFSDQATMNFADIWVYVGIPILAAGQFFRKSMPASAHETPHRE